jgi:3-oxoacyl-[acyl-carrier-protein] synthase I
MGAALAAGLPPGARAGTTWCDLNGEPWRADEWGYAYLRTSDRHGEPLRLRHPADALGELGAATGTMLVLLAALDLAHPRTVAQSALVFAASDTRPHRAACLVSKRPEEGKR